MTLGLSLVGILLSGTLSFDLSDVIDLPAVFGMHFQPGLGEQIAQIGLPEPPQIPDV